MGPPGGHRIAWDFARLDAAISGRVDGRQRTRVRPKRCFGDFVDRFRFDFVLHLKVKLYKTKENEKQNENEKHCLGRTLFESI